MSDRVIEQREVAAPDSDTATAQTVRLMCQYIAQGVADSRCREAAQTALNTFAPDVSKGIKGSGDREKCWAVWWYVKHCIKYRSDEATMFRIGQQGEQDLLIAPAVLLRMDSPAEDCDGFTMLVATLLTILGVKCVISTVAVDPSDPSRWSHVFCCALLEDGTILPLDASHGSGPGWMVPDAHTYRFQSWDLNGSPVDVRPARRSVGLHGYRRTNRGLAGDACTDFNIGCELTGISTPTPVTLPGSSGGGGTDWTQFLQGLANSGVNLATKILTPPTYQQTVSGPGGSSSTTIRSATPSTALTAGAGGAGVSTSTMLLIGGAILAVVVIASSKK